MAPEQMTGTCTPESDVFTLGIVMYELIAGKRPYGEAKGPAAQLAAVLGDAPPLVTPAPLELTSRSSTRCIDKDPTRRYRNAHELQFALERFSDGADEAPTNFVPSTSKKLPTPWVEPTLGVTLHGIAPNLVARGSSTAFSDRKSAAGDHAQIEPGFAGQSNAAEARCGVDRASHGVGHVGDRERPHAGSDPGRSAPSAEVSAGVTTTPTPAAGVPVAATPNMRVVIIAIVIAIALIALGLLL